MTSSHKVMTVGPMIVRILEASVDSPADAWIKPAPMEPRPAPNTTQPIPIRFTTPGINTTSIASRGSRKGTQSPTQAMAVASKAHAKPRLPRARGSARPEGAHAASLAPAAAMATRLAPHTTVPVSVRGLDAAAWAEPRQRAVLVYSDPLEQAVSYFNFCRNHFAPA